MLSSAVLWAAEDKRAISFLRQHSVFPIALM